MRLQSLNIGIVVQKFASWIILLILMIVFTCLSPNFLTKKNIVNILSQNAYILVASLGVTFVLLAGSIDLSIGYQMSLVGIISAILMIDYRVPVFLVIPIALAAGVIMSLLNGILSTKMKLPLMMVSLGTMISFQGLSYVISQSRTINRFPESFKFLGQGSVGNIPFPVLLSFALFFIVNFFLNHTYFGQYVYALGGNEEASRLSGINVKRMRLMVSVICGFFTALSAIMLVGRAGSAHSGTGPGTEFTVITAIILGGVSMGGGSGKLSGVLAGVFSLALISNGMQLAGLGTYYQYVAKGIILLGAIGFDVFQKERQKSEKSLRRQMEKRNSP